MFIETSAKAGVNIKQLFQNLAQSLPGMESSTSAISGGGNTPAPVSNHGTASTHAPAQNG